MATGFCKIDQLVTHPITIVKTIIYCKNDNLRAKFLIYQVYLKTYKFILLGI